MALSRNIRVPHIAISMDKIGVNPKKLHITNKVAPKIDAVAYISFCKTKGICPLSRSRTMPPTTPVIQPIPIATGPLNPKDNAFCAPIMVNIAKPKASRIGNKNTGKRCI